MKKFLKITGIVLLSLFILAFIIPVVFKKQITRLVKKEINKNLTARVDFDDASLSLLRHFPKMTIVLKGLSVVGTQEFDGDTLLAAKRIEAAANIFSVIKGKNIKIYGAYLQSPRIHALVNKMGKANWDIVKSGNDTSTKADTSASVFKMSLRNYSIHDGYIEYKDEKAGTYTEWDHVEHSGSGDFSLDEFTLSTNTHADRASLVQDGIPYLANAETDVRADIDINNKTNTYTFNTDRIVLNDLKLTAKGFFQLVNDSTYKMDISFRSPTNEFKNILSLIPAVYKKDFDKLETDGKAAFEGFVKGVYSPASFPAYDIKLDVNNGSFKYPDLPKSVRNIQFNLRATNPDGLPDNAVIDIPKGHMEMDKEPFDFRFLLKNPQTARYIDAAAKGNLDLSQVSQFIKLGKDTKLSGLVRADAYAKGNMSVLEKLQGPFNAGGFFDIRDLFYSSPEFPQPLRNGNLNLRLDNSGGVADKTSITVTTGHIEVGKDPVDFNLQLSNPVSAMNFSGVAKGRFTLNNLKQFTDLSEGASLSGLLTADLGFSGNKKLVNDGDFDKLNLKGIADLSNVKYVSKEYPSGLSIHTASFHFNPPQVSVNDFSGSYLGSNFTGSGTLSNLLGFIVRNTPLGGSLNASMDKMDLNAWTGTKETTPAAGASVASSSPGPAQPFLVPANMNISVNARAGKLTYDKVDYSNINGNLQISDQAIKIQDVKAEALDGAILLNGVYSTKTSKQKPDINVSYDVQNMDVQKVFNAFNTVRFLMPIGKFLSGKLNSALSMTGSLRGDMMPDLKSLTGKGNLLLLQGVLKKFAPLEKIATTLQIDRLKSISVRDIKNYIEFANGKVLVKPFNLKIDDIEMVIGGRHGFDESIDYVVGMKFPRSYMGNAGNSLVEGLIGSANQKGIPLKLSDKIDLNIKVVGTLSNPSIRVDLAQMVGNVTDELKKQAVDFAKEKLDSVKQKLKDTVSSVTDRIRDSLKQRLKDQFFGRDTGNSNKPVDSSSKPPIIDIKKNLRDLFRKKSKPADTTKNNQ